MLELLYKNMPDGPRSACSTAPFIFLAVRKVLEVVMNFLGRARAPLSVQRPQSWRG